MDVFTSRQKELEETGTRNLRSGKLDSEPVFSGKIDSRGRITVPSKIREKLDLEKGDTVSLSLNNVCILREKFSSKEKALGFVSDLEGVSGFSFDGEILEVIING